MWNLKIPLGTLLFSLCTRYLRIKFCENLLTSLAVICETTSETDRTNKCQTLEDKTDHSFAYWITIAFWMIITILSSVGQHFLTLICLILRYFLHVKRIINRYKMRLQTDTTNKSWVMMITALSGDPGFKFIHSYTFEFIQYQINRQLFKKKCLIRLCAPTSKFS